MSDDNALQTIVGTFLEGSIDLYGDEGYYVVSKEDLVYIAQDPKTLATELWDALKKRADKLGKKFVFTVEEGMHRDFGWSYYISWRLSD